MAKDTEKKDSQILPVRMSKEVHDALLRIQAKRQLKSGKRASLKSIAADIILNAKA